MKDFEELKYIAECIKQEYSCGYYPFWELSFDNEWFRGQFISDENRDLIADCVLLGNTRGFIMNDFENSVKEIGWKIKF